MSDSHQKGFKDIKGKNSGLKSIYDTYKIRVDRTMATAFGYLGWLSDEDNYNNYYNDYFEQYGYLNKYFPSSFFLTDNTTLNNYKTKSRESYVLYEPLDLSEDDNKYCIYWYRWEKNYTPPENETFLPSGWRRMTADDNDFSSPHSIGDSDGENIGLSALYYYDD